MPISRTIATLSLLAACAGVRAGCPSTLPLQGTINVDNCYPMRDGCIPAAEALYRYNAAAPDDGEEVLSISLHGSPWHLYDSDYRILLIEDLASMVRQQGNKIQRVRLMSSWSGIAPEKGRKPLTQQLADALGGMKVSGPDGFLWIDKDGNTSTTRQAFSLFVTGPYAIQQNGKVMASLAVGWSTQFEDAFAREKNADGLLLAGVGHEAFNLCPERALASFESAAALGHPVAAYNAAVLRLERNSGDDRTLAVALLRKAATAGDKASAALLGRTALPHGRKP